MKPIVSYRTFVALAVTLWAAQAAPAATYNWTGAGGADLFWSTPGNWTAGGPPGAADTAYFDDLGATNDVGVAAIDNVVATSTTVLALAYGQTNGVHNTFINTGATLSVVNTASGNVLLAGTETDNGSAQRETNSISGPGGLILNNPSGNVVVRQGSAAGNGAKAVLDLSGLETFTASVARVLVGVAVGPTINRSTGLLILAKRNTITAASATVPAIDIGRSASNNGGGSMWYLGQTNAIFADSLSTSSEKEVNSSILFNPAFASPVAYFRAANGTDRVNRWAVGDGGSNSGTTTCRGTNDFTGGTLDAQVNTMIIGRASTAGTGANTSVGMLTFDAGILDVNLLQVGLQTTANSKAGNGTVNVNGTAALIVNSSLELGPTTGGTGAANAIGTLNVNGGTVVANVITNAGAGTTAITLTGGKLIVTNFLGSVGSVLSPITSLSAGDSTLTLAASAGTPAIVVRDLVPTSTTNNTINVVSIPVVSEYPAQFPLIQCAQLGFSDYVLGTLPVRTPAYQGYLSNNLANNSIDLVLTAGPLPKEGLQWSGSASGDWDTTSLNWTEKGTASVFQSGDPVLFADSATGTTTVNLTDALQPGSITVSNVSKPYVFTGPGKLTGPTGLKKEAAGTLTIANSTPNDFAGSIVVNGGSLVVGDGANSGALPSASIENNASVAFNRADNISVPNNISGTGSLTQEGTGTLTLAGQKTYTGPTVVNAGTLALNTDLAGGGMLTNAPGTLIAGNGTNAGPVNVAGRISPGSGSTIGSIGAGDLTLEPSGALALDLNPGDGTPGSGVNDIVEVAGNLHLNNNVVYVNFQGIPQVGASYRVLDYTGTKTGSFNAVAQGTHYTVAIDESTLNQVNAIVQGGSGANLKWASTSSPAWDNGASANWLNLANGLPDRFYSGDSVLLDDSVSGVVANITVDAGVWVAPTAVTVNSSANDFSITGDGKIIGSGSIVKNGSSVFTLGTANDTFTGTIDVQAGTLKAGNRSALGTAANGTTIASGATLDVNGFNVSTEAVTVSGGGVGGLGAIVNSGAQQTTALKTVILAGNTTFGGTGRWDIRGGSASLSTGGQPFNIVKKGTNQVSLVAVDPIDPMLGNIDIEEGTFAIQTTTVQVGDPAKTITIYSNATLNVYNLSASTVNKYVVLKDGATFYSENSRSTVDGQVTLQSGTGTFNVNSAGSSPSLTISTGINGQGGLVKVGSAPLILSGLNNYAGSTVVSNGSLVVDGSLAGSGVTVHGGTLAGIGTISSRVTTTAGGNLSPGGNGVNGTLTITAPVTLGGTIVMDVNKSGGLFTGDFVTDVTSLTYGGTLQLALTGEALVEGDVITLFKFSSASGAFAAISPANPGAGLAWDTSRLTVDGTLKVSIPKNPPVISGITVSGSDLVITGSGGVDGATYYVLSTTNAALPLVNWIPVATNVFGAGGSFSISQSIDPAVPSRFYLLQLP